MKYFYLIFFLFPLLLNAQIFVDRDANGSNDGSSWDNAYTDLQDAIQNAPLEAEVWVAAGTYLPSPDGNIDSTFTLTQSIELYGGFSGIETDLSERDIEGNLTTLSGDYNADDNLVVSTDPLSLSFSNNADNAKRIITAVDATGSIIVDGFTISGANMATSSGGGMIFTPDVELTVLVKNCTLKNNVASSGGGAIRVGASADEVLNFSLENSSAINNRCGGKGGVVWASGNGTTNADYINVLFHQNSSGNRAGAVNHDGDAHPTFENCIFSENRATNGGAIFEVINMGSTFRNCTFYKNTASTQASVIWNYNNGGENVKMQNCIFHNNGSTPLYNTGGIYEISNTAIEYNDWADFTSQGNSNAMDLGGNLYNVDPLFMDETVFDFNLSANSPMVNVGNNTSVQMGSDHTGYISRIVDGTVDLGAMEYHLPFSANITATLLCFGEDFGFAEVAGDNYAPFTYQWNNAAVQGGTPNNLAATGNHQVTVTNSIGDTEVLNFTLTENPEINFTFNVVDPTGSNADGMAMINLSGGIPPFTLAWNTNPVQTTSTATGLANGTYTVTITDANGCSTLASVDVGVTSAVLSVDDSKEIEIGPNPFHENVRIILSGNLLEQSTLTEVLIYNTTGGLVYHSPLSSDSNTSINLSELSTGLYFMELVGKDLRFRKRLIKQ